MASDCDHSYSWVEVERTARSQLHDSGRTVCWDYVKEVNKCSNCQDERGSRSFDADVHFC